MHSQKGGVGKTSFALATAGIAAAFNQRKVLVIDADLTGTSLVDMPGWSQGKVFRYFNDLILAKPSEFGTYTSRRSKSGVEPFCHPVPDHDGLFYMAASPCHDHIQRIVPLISQEDRLHFFRHRLQDIVEAVMKSKLDIDVVIVDHPPGLFGISMASLNMVLDPPKGSFLSDIAMQAVLLTTPDRVDYRALIPSFSRLLEKASFFDFDSLHGKIRLFLNKAAGLTRRPYDPALSFRDIINDFKDLGEGRHVNPKVIAALTRGAKEKGVSYGVLVRDFRITEILSTIQNLEKSSIEEGGGGPLEKMKDWCQQVGSATDLIEEAPILGFSGPGSKD